LSDKFKTTEQEANLRRKLEAGSTKKWGNGGGVKGAGRGQECRGEKKVSKKGGSSTRRTKKRRET